MIFAMSVTKSKIMRLQQSLEELQSRGDFDPLKLTDHQWEQLITISVSQRKSGEQHLFSDQVLDKWESGVRDIDELLSYWN